MEHSSHAHPLSDGRKTSSDGSTVLSYASCTISSPPTLASQPQEEGLSQQTKRLHLRNNGFRGPILPFRRISPLLGAAPNGIEPYTRPTNNDESPASAEKRILYGEHLPQSPVNILQEIHRLSTKKRRPSPRPGFGPIFEDGTRKEDASGKSWYNEGSNEASPATPARMHQLREISLNPKTPSPLSSPSVKHVKKRNADRKHRSASSETAAQYIEHLESELASAHARLDLQLSPKTSKLRAAKVRALTIENRNLKHEISEWQRNLDDRIQEERSKRLDADMEIRSSMRMMEDESESKNSRLAELEWELESMRVRLRDLEGLEAININLEKRIEALTNLLVHSPTKVEVPSPSTSPFKRDPSKRTPRPRSMLPRIPASPGGLQSSLSTVSEGAFGRSQSVGYFSDAVESPVEEPREGIDIEDLQLPTGEEDSISPTAMRQSGSSDGRWRTSRSFRSTPPSASKRTSLRSSCSFGPASWGLTEHEHRSVSKQRKMRRFPSGSNSLKPLILPTSNVTPSIPASATAFSPSEVTARRDPSTLTLGQTSTFFSALETNSATSTPEHFESQRSSKWAQEQTLIALEGKRRDRSGSDDSVSGELGSPCPNSEGESIGYRKMSTSSGKRRSRPRSLQKELEEAEMELDEDISRHTVIGLDPSPHPVPFPPAHSQNPRQASDPDPTPRPSQKQGPAACAGPVPSKASPSIASTNEHTYGLFSRLTQIITQTKQDPCILARRLLADAWSHGSKRLGGIAWWLLGLVYGTRWHDQKSRADSGVVESGSTQNLDWQHFSAEAGKNRSTRNYSRVRDGRRSATEPCAFPRRSSGRAVPPTDQSSDSRRQPHLFPCDKCVEPSSRRTLRLWLQFSLAIILAVGMAVKHGPGTLLCDHDPDSEGSDHAQTQETEPLPGDQHQKTPKLHDTRRFDEYSQPSANSDDTNGVDSGYGSMTFAQALDPSDSIDQ